MERREAGDRERRSLLERVAPHWPLVLALSVVAAAVLWWASYGIAW